MWKKGLNRPVRKKKTVFVLISLAITILLLGLLYSRIDMRDFLDTLAHIHLPFLFLFMLISLANTFLRSWRYRWLLQPQKIGVGAVFLVTLIRNVFVDLLPARIGSLSYIYILNKRFNFSFESAASSLLVSIFFDFLTLSPFLILAAVVVGSGGSAVSLSLLIAIAVLFFGLVFVLYTRLRPLLLFVIKIVQSILKVFRLQDKPWARLIDEKGRLTIKELEGTKQRGIFWPLFIVSFLIRSAKYGALYFLLAALLKSHGYVLRQISFWKTVLGINGAELTSVLPIKGIGGFGTWESAWALSFQLMDFDSRLAVITGIGVHLITNLFEYILGIAAILVLVAPLLLKKKVKGKME